MAAKSSNANPEDIAQLSYEQAIAALEAIIDRIESGEVGLEDAVKAYERGVVLREHCRKILDRAEQRISELTPSASPADDQQDGERGAGKT